MPNYRRAWAPGATFFFTVNLLDRSRWLLAERIDALRDAFRAARAVQPFDIVAIAVMADHLHCVWRLPDGDADNAMRWRRIKSAFARALPAAERRSAVRRARCERGIWQRRFWERVIVDDADLHAHVDYVHYNPVKHGWARRACDWPHSTVHRYVRDGVLTPDWGDADA